MSRIVGDSPRSHCKSAFKLNLWNAARTNSTLGRSRGPGSELASKVAAKVGNGSHAFPNKSSPLLAWSRYPSAGMSHLHELLGRPIIFHRYTPKKTETRGISVALLPPPRHTICITDISRARDLYVLRTTSSSNLKLTDLPAGHKLTHECDDNYSSWYIYTSVCAYIYVHMQVAITARVYLAGRKNSGRGGGTNASRGFTRRDLLPQSAASSRVTSIWPFYLLWKKVSFFFYSWSQESRNGNSRERGRRFLFLRNLIYPSRWKSKRS